LLFLSIHILKFGWHNDAVIVVIIFVITTAEWLSESGGALSYANADPSVREQ